MDGIKNYTELLARLLLAGIFLAAGLNKIGSYETTQAFMESMNVSGSLLFLVIIVEVAGAISLILGWWTRVGALALAVFTVIAACLFHGNFDDQIQMILFMKNMAITGGLLLLVANGAGEISLDQR